LKFRNLTFIDVGDHVNDEISKNISFYKSEHKHSPMLFGFIKIKILLPVDWDDWSTLQQRTAIVHELAHIKQKDHWINILELIVFALYYFNPLVWLIIRRVNEYNELVCDDVTIETIESSGIEYSKQLLHFSEAYSNLNRVLASSVAFTESYRSIRKRFAYHLSKQEGFVMKNFKSKSIIVIVMCSLITIPFLWQCNNGESEQSVTTSIDNSEKIYDMNEVTEKPEMLHKEYPVYPEEARKAGVGGMTVVTVTIDELGNVEEAKIFRSSNPLFDEVSLTAAKKCKFKPAKLHDQIIKVNMNIPFSFKLR
jgi:TonB family protein